MRREWQWKPGWHVSHLLSLCLFVFAGCRDNTLRNTSLQLRFAPESLSFGQVYLQQPQSRTVVLVNASRSRLEVEWKMTTGRFTGEFPKEVPSGETPIVITFLPQSEGDLQDVLVAQAEGVEAQLMLSGRGISIPTCESTSSCRPSTFNVETGKCEETVVADGTSCDPRSLCIQEAVCLQGRCVGKNRTCDDNNQCTIDVCQPNTGCEFLPAPPCPGDGKCQVGACDPQLGCALKPASDGTLCGSTQTCDVVDVCIAGQCVQRNPPDGYVCAEASPCQQEGRCQGSTCVQPPAVALTPGWTFDSTAQVVKTADVTELHDLVLEPSGAMTLSGFFATPWIRANTAQSFEGVTPARRCILWNGRLVCADYPYSGSGKVSAIDMGSGQTLWTHDLPRERPDFAVQTAPGRLFLARLAALGPDRLAAVFEAYPKGTDSGTQCRKYYLSILDAQGRLISAQQMVDDFLDICSHPHPYGVVADTVGNLFIAFSQSDVGVAPLVPQSPSLLMSFTRDGIVRWQRIENFVGGELAAARGLIFPEKSDTAYTTSTGAPLTLGGLPSGTFGRVVATSERLIPAPEMFGQTLKGYELQSTGGYVERWFHREPEGFLSSQIRLASWKQKPASTEETIALVFASRAQQPHVVAIRPQQGHELWSCPLNINFRTGPQLVEVANSFLAIMEGASTCGTCDPPFAGSAATFHSLRLPGLGVANEPWVGTFGGAGHDHLEDAALPNVATPQ